MDILPRQQLKEIEEVKHSAVFYQTRNRQLSVTAPFIARGLEKGERCVYVTAANSENTIIEQLGKIYKGDLSTLKSGQLIVEKAKDVYLEDGVFLQERIFNGLENLYSQTVREGYTGLRCTGDMEWILKNFEYLGALREYEFNTDSQIKEYKNITLLCQYNTEVYSGEFLKDMAMIHSCVIKGDYRGGLFPRW